MGDDQIPGEWLPTNVHYEGANLWPSQREGYAYGGLLLVPAYDPESSMFWPDYWAVWHLASGISIIDQIAAPLERALEIAARLAELMDWQMMDLPDEREEAMVDLKLIGFAVEFPDEVAAQNPWMLDAADLESLIPYRT